MTTCKSPVAYFVACYNEQSGPAKTTRALGLEIPGPLYFPDSFLSFLGIQHSIRDLLIVYRSRKKENNDPSFILK